MTIRPARAAGLAASGALLAASLFAPAMAQAPAGDAAAPQGPPVVQPQVWPQCIVLLERSADLDGGPDNAAAMEQQFRDSLDILAEVNNVTDEQLQQAFTDIGAALDEVESDVIVRDATACAGAAPHPDMFAQAPEQ